MSRTTNLNDYLRDALNVIRFVLSKQGVTPPDLRAEKRDYEKFKLEQLSKLTNDYLKIKGYDSLRIHKELIRDFQIVSEVNAALRHLRNEFGELISRSNDFVRRTEGFTLFSQMEETVDLSSSCF